MGYYSDNYAVIAYTNTFTVKDYDDFVRDVNQHNLVIKSHGHNQVSLTMENNQPWPWFEGSPPDMFYEIDFLAEYLTPHLSPTSCPIVLIQTIRDGKKIYGGAGIGYADGTVREMSLEEMTAVLLNYTEIK